VTARRAVVAIVFVAACKKSPPATPTPAGEVTCDQVGGSIAASMQSGSGADATIQQAIVAAVVESCRVDAWSESARRCFVAGDAGADAAERCKNEVTDEQIRKLDDRIDSSIAKAAPASCTDLPPAITASLSADLDKLQPDQRTIAEAKIALFVSDIAVQCSAGWSVEARTCVRDADATDAGRCARWLDDAQRAAYQTSVEAAFGQPPPEPPP
jgi:hypothetical protein